MREVEHAIAVLIRKERFYGELLMGMRKHYNHGDVPTLGVNVKDGVINLYINKEFFINMTKEQRGEVLKHECHHILGEHLTKRSHKQHKMWNIASDASINENLPTLTELGGVTPERLSEQCGYELQKGMHSEYYMKHIQKNKDKFEQMLGSGEGVIDDHAIWQDGDQDADLVEATIKDKVDKAVKKIGRENLPYDVAKQVERLFSSKVDWKREVRQFAANAVEFTKTATRKKRHRRYGTVFPGKRKDYHVNLAIGIDESGSVSDKEFSAFFTEIDKLVDENVTLTMIHCDTQISNVYEYKKGMKVERNACGGTLYKPVLEKAKELKVDALFYFGDGDCFENDLVKPKFPVAWVMVGRWAKKPTEWGKEIKVEVEE